MAAHCVDKKKKLAQHIDRNSRDKSSGMSASTKRHFDHVKQKMFAFVDRQQQMEFDGIHVAPPPIFADQNKAPKQRIHYHTPVPPRKQLQNLPPHAPAQKQLPHLALATPQVGRRGKKPQPSIDAKLSPLVVMF